MPRGRVTGKETVTIRGTTDGRWNKTPSESCEACLIIEGGNLCNEVLSEYRGHNICDWCLRKWRELEKRCRRVIEFEQFKKGEYRRHKLDKLDKM